MPKMSSACTSQVIGYNHSVTNGFHSSGFCSQAWAHHVTVIPAYSGGAGAGVRVGGVGGVGGVGVCGSVWVVWVVCVVWVVWVVCVCVCRP